MIAHNLIIPLALAMLGGSAADMPSQPLGLPAGLDMHPPHGRARLEGDALVVHADAKTDFYVPSDGSAATLSAPLVVFPVSGDFIFSSRVTLDLKTDFDGAALIVYGDTTHWAKLLVERSRADLIGPTSSVVDGMGDDAYHGVMAPGQTSLFLKVTRTGTTYVFYTSVDAETWSVARSFTLPQSKALSLGFEVQSPVGPGFDARFDQVRFAARTAKDYWQGE